VGEARAEALHASGVLAVFGEQSHSAGHQYGGQLARRRQRHHHRRQALVAGGGRQHAGARGQRANQAAKHIGGVVAVRQAVKHPGRALRPAVARIGAIAGERNRVE